MTFSIAGFCPRTGQYGIALSSSSMAVAARCPWLLSGVGAVSSQNVTLPSLGPQILAKLAQGSTAQQALDAVIAAEPYADWREQDAIGELARLWQLWQPQSEAYLTRAINPAEAPSYGVPGDE